MKLTTDNCSRHKKFQLLTIRKKVFHPTQKPLSKLLQYFLCENTFLRAKLLSERLEHLILPKYLYRNSMSLSSRTKWKAIIVFQTLGFPFVEEIELSIRIYLRDKKNEAENQHVFCTLAVSRQVFPFFMSFPAIFVERVGIR